VVPGLTGITEMAVGFDHMLALDSGGTVWSWGDNTEGELGNGTTSGVAGSNPTPVPVPGLTGVTQIAAGVRYSLALRSDGTVWAWGWNNDGQLGDGTTVDRNRPERLAGLTGVTRLIAGDHTSYALKVGGTLLAWGDNSGGLLGNGTTTGISAVPVAVPGLAGVTSVSTSAGGTLAVAGAAGTMWSWGTNYNGQLGNGTTTPRYSPAPTSLTGVTQVSSGVQAQAAVMSSGQVMTWGDDQLQALGRASRSGAAIDPTPAPLTTLAAVTQAAVGVNSGLSIGRPAPRVPSVIGQTQAEAAQTLQAGGYTLGRVAFIVDLTCEYIGEVKTQSPAAGSIAAPGTSVSVGIGKPGGKCL
jgi:alpha-tubulin suppressor-like RCC1 family protein